MFMLEDLLDFFPVWSQYVAASIERQALKVTQECFTISLCPVVSAEGSEYYIHVYTHFTTLDQCSFENWMSEKLWLCLSYMTIRMTHAEMCTNRSFNYIRIHIHCCQPGATTWKQKPCCVLQAEQQRLDSCQGQTLRWDKCVMMASPIQIFLEKVDK